MGSLVLLNSTVSDRDDADASSLIMDDSGDLIDVYKVAFLLRMALNFTFF